MSHLTDMEELASSIKNENIRDYMEEALACYMAGAYRASVVLTFIALFDDITEKLETLGKVNKKAKDIYDAAVQKRSDQGVFETYLIDQLKSNSLFSTLDAEFLEILRKLRNKAAHPSGHHASAEEARFVYSEAVSRFLSKPILSTTQLADEILASLSNANIFPSTGINVIAEVVKKDLEHIHPLAYPYLISKVLEKTQATDVDSSRNARFFLAGMARIGEAEAILSLKKYAIEKIAANKKHKVEVITLLCSNGSLFSDLDNITYKRIAVLITEQVQDVKLTVEHTNFSHPASLFVSLFSSNPGNFILEKLGKQFEEFLERFTYSAFFSSRIINIEEPRRLLLDKLYEKAGSGDFGTANGFVKNSVDIEKIMGDSLSSEEAFRLIANITRAAERGAFSAIDMRNAHFGSLPKTKASAYSLLVKDIDSAKAITQEIFGTNDENLEELTSYLKEDDNCL